jgi:UDP-N-acetylglucosamine 4,6-dehydratase
MTEISQLENQCPSFESISAERVLIFGGSGSLGKTVIQRWIHYNYICNFSRDEEKQWALKTSISHQNLVQIIGDIANADDVERAIIRFNPTIICIFACLKHIDICETYPDKSLINNCQGIINVHRALEKNRTSVKTVLFVSTDKACLPITTYGCSKAISEFYLQGIPSGPTKWVGVRYGNVLNSSGSIIPYLKKQSQMEGPLRLTHPDMTRFIMTLEQSVNLIEYAITCGEHNEIIIPFIHSMRISDLFAIFEEKYEKAHIVSGLRCKEKINEDLLSPFEAPNSYMKNGYYHLTNSHTGTSSTVLPFDSSCNLITKEQLYHYLSINYLL